MKKQEVLKRMEVAGDAVITYRSQNSKKLKYNVCTLEFDCEYIQSKRNKAEADKDSILFFCWDTDSFRLLKTANIVNIIALSSMLR